MFLNESDCFLSIFGFSSLTVTQCTNAMRFMEHPLLSRLSVLVNELNVGDRLLCGKLELFSTEKSSLVQKKSALSQQEVNLGSKRQRISLEYGVDSAEALSQNDTPRQRTSIANSLVERLNALEYMGSFYAINEMELLVVLFMRSRDAWHRACCLLCCLRVFRSNIR